MKEGYQKRWDEMTPEYRAWFREQRSQGMKRYWASLTPEQRHEIAAKAAKTRRERNKHGKS